MKVSLVDLRSQYLEIEKSASRDIRRLMKKGDFILGQDVRKFEAAFSEFVGSRYALGVNSGTDALFLSLLSTGVKPGDEVIVPVFTYIASAFAVTYAGAKPVFVDIDPQTYDMDPLKIERTLTKKTKAIMPVHLYGQAADMEKVGKIAKKYHLKVIEDAAQAHGAEYRGRKVGALGDAGAFSFYPTKNLSAFGDAGMVVTNHAEIFEKLKKLRDYGRRTRYEHDTVGYNSRLDSMQAVFLYHKLKRLNRWNDRRISIAGYYKKCLEGIEEIILPWENDLCRHVYHVFAILLKDRDRVALRLKKCGIDTMVYYPVPLHLQSVYRSFGYRRGDFPVAEHICQNVLCLPIHPHMTTRHADYVVKNLKRIIQHG